jgi:hypothetical protein
MGLGLMKSLKGMLKLGEIGLDSSISMISNQKTDMILFLFVQSNNFTYYLQIVHID